MSASSLTCPGKVCIAIPSLHTPSHVLADLTVQSTTGKPTIPGATRSFVDGISVTETLLEYISTPEAKYYYYGYKGPATLAGLSFANLVNLVKVTNITTGVSAASTAFECKYLITNGI